METILGADPAEPEGGLKTYKMVVQGCVQPCANACSSYARATLDQIKAERVELYSYVPSLGKNIPVIVKPVKVDDLVPTEKEIEKVVKKLRQNRSGGPLGMQDKHLKGRLAASKRGRRAEEKGEEKTEGEEEEGEPNWENLVELVQTVFQEGELAEEATWQAVVMIPKGQQEYRVIGQVEMMWKVVVAILHCRFTSSITYHVFLHRFRAGRGTGTATRVVRPSTATMVI